MLSWLTELWIAGTEWFKSTSLYRFCVWVYDTMTNPTINFLVGVLFIVFVELLLGTLGFYGLWPYLLGALLCSTVMFLRVDELPSDKKFSYLVFWYVLVALLSFVNPMGWFTTIVLYDTGWVAWFINGTVVSALYSIPVSLGVAVLSYNK